jgi:hypothetical protein
MAKKRGKGLNIGLIFNYSIGHRKKSKKEVKNEAKTDESSKQIRSRFNWQS